MRALETGLIDRPGTTDDRFAAYVAHELRTPIALQRLLAEAMLADPGADPRAMCEEVIVACDNQQRLIDALLELTRSRRRRIRRQPVDLALMTRRVLGAHDLGDLERVVALEPALACGDPTLLERLCANLLSNAIRHNVPHGRVDVTTATTDGRAVLCVGNTGPAVSRRQLARLFEPFERGPRRGHCTAGLGLGLSIVESIAHAHAAMITALPRAGGGLSVEVGFPAHLGAAAGAPAG